MGKVIEGKIMPTGWNYIEGCNEKFEGGDVIRGGSYDELLENIMEYRVANNLPVGNPRLDAEKQICARYPTQCKGYSPYTDPNIPQAREIRMIDRIARWAASIIDKAGRRKVRPEEAERRAEICTHCDQNVNWLSGCTGCVKNAERLCALIRGSSESSKQTALRACRILGHCNRTAIWLDLEFINKADSLPNHCWAKKQ